MEKQTDQVPIMLARPFSHAGGKMWETALPGHLYEYTDTDDSPLQCRLRLYEDGRKIGPPHSVHDAITSLGRGRYSFWKGFLHFSTPDDTDPNSNGRTYSIAAEPITVVDEILRMPLAREWQVPPSKLRLAVIGMGNRGLHLAKLAKKFAGAEIVLMVDRSEERLSQAAKQVGAVGARLARDWTGAIEDSHIDAVLVTVPDHLHRPVAEAAFHARKHVYVEKPLATTIDNAAAIVDAWTASGRILHIGYVLRYAPFYRAIRQVISAGALGSIRVVTTSEHLDLAHGASFMRRWHSQSANSGGLLVHKCCHDLDLICWLFETKPRRVSSFGGRNTFVRDPPSPSCSQCGERWECPYVDTGMHESRTPAEAANPSAFGLDRCVFDAQNDIVDNQIVSFEMASGARGSHYLAVQGRRTERRIAIVGDAGRLDGLFEDGKFTIEFSDLERETFHWSAGTAGTGPHGGGDVRLVQEFLDVCLGRQPPPLSTPEDALSGLVFAFAAELSRTTGRIIDSNSLWHPAH